MKKIMMAAFIGVLTTREGGQYLTKDYEISGGVGGFEARMCDVNHLWCRHDAPWRRADGSAAGSVTRDARF